MKTLNVPIKDQEYNIHIEKDILKSIERYVDVNRETVIITDDNVPKIYLDTIKHKFSKSHIKIIPHGESSKSMEMASLLVNFMLENSVSRSAQIIALGGGVVGDLVGFVSSIYMRGIDFIQIPTTLLSQIDSSVGGKTAVNSKLAKNSIGSFKQPKLVLIDPNTLYTLTDRHLNNGVAEMIKYAFIRSKSLYEDLLNKELFDGIEDKILECLSIKRDIVLVDTYDNGIRQILNFGHTIGHGIEIASNFDLLHGEAVAIGMLNMVTEPVLKEKLLKLVNKYNLPTSYDYDKEIVYNLIKNDKKASNKSINIILVEELGNGFIKTIDIEEIKEYMR